MDNDLSYETINRFYREKKGSLDAVYFGGSEVNAFWQPTFGWNDRGIAVWDYTVDSVPADAMKYMMMEVHKTQPQALFIISLGAFKKDTAVGSMEAIHRLIDYMPFSLNKVRMIHHLVEGTEYTGLDRLEFYFPIIRFHTRWDELGKWVLGAADEDYKSSRHRYNFRNNVLDIREDYHQSDERVPVPEDIKAAITEVLDYCDEQQLQVLFVKTPQARLNETLGRMNTIEDMITARGYLCLDLLKNVEDTGLNLQTDFYNRFHTNVHGSLKYSHDLADYLVEHYGFTDKRGTAGWESWDEAAEAYIETLRYAVLPFEFEDGPRDFSLDIPKLSTPKKKGTTVTVKWEPSDGADGYEIFRLCEEDDNLWHSINTVDSDTLTYRDSDLKAQTTYYYRIVPYRMIDGVRAYGNFDVNSVSITTGDKK